MDYAWHDVVDAVYLRFAWFLQMKFSCLVKLDASLVYWADANEVILCDCSFTYKYLQLQMKACLHSCKWYAVLYSLLLCNDKYYIHCEISDINLQIQSANVAYYCATIHSQNSCRNLQYMLHSQSVIHKISPTSCIKSALIFATILVSQLKMCL